MSNDSSSATAQLGPPKDRRSRHSGINYPDIPTGEDAKDRLSVALYYIGFFVEEYARVRAGEKRRAKSVVVGVAGGNGLIAVLGAMTALWGLPWIALITTGISSLLTVVAAWDGLVKHRELWVRRTVVCSHLAEIERIYRMRAINCKDKDELADEAMTALNTILGDDVAGWTELRNTRELPKSDSEEVAVEPA